jgi:hypothetical protein
LVAALLICATLAAYMGAMALLGLPLLPSSVLIKAPSFSSSHLGVFARVLSALSSAVQYKPAVALWLASALVILHPILRGRGVLRPAESEPLTFKRELVFVATVLGAVLAHAMFGSWGWWYRYETYVLTMTVAAGIVLWSAQIRSFVADARPLQVALAVLALFAIDFPYLKGTALDPFAGRGIYEQQYQMHRFAVDFYRQPVAANDIGWLSYRNPLYVLDLWGLGSETARKARLVTHEPGWMDELTHAHHVTLAMIYSNWFQGDIPASWQKIGTLHGVHRPVSSASDDVTFYATAPEAVTASVAALAQLKEATVGVSVVTLSAAAIHEDRK